MSAFGVQNGLRIVVLHGLNVIVKVSFNVHEVCIGMSLYVDRGPEVSLLRHFDIHGLHIGTVPKLVFSLKTSFGHKVVWCICVVRWNDIDLVVSELCV